MKLIKSVLFPFIIFLPAAGFPQDLRHQIDSAICGFKAQIGVAVYDLSDGDTITIGNSHHYPMQSVFKFPLALAILNRVDNKELKTDQRIHLSKDDLRSDTWSPLKDQYPEGNVEIPLKEILKYAVSESDNNGCDILFRLDGGPVNVERYIQGLGITDISIKATENEMHRDWEEQYKNWITPFAAVELLKKFYSDSILSDSSRELLWQLMVNTKTGKQQLKGLLPEGTTVAHKTGFSGTNGKGLTAAVNDIGIIQLPGNHALAVAVFVSDSMERYESNEHIIAAIAKIIWDYYSR